ncbi:hypothetical protein [Endozoicomonas sp. ALD040]|uniref:hypothetical protein n=1 Tax=Endozoicomonas sp. ALD040 TaxID=3403079 RepID=UPI003BB067F0
MAYGLTPTTDSSATGAKFQPPQNSSAGSDTCPATTSNGRRLVEPASSTSSTSATGYDLRQRGSLDQRTCQWLEELQSFTGQNVTDVNRAASSVATTAESEPSQYCESEGTGKVFEKIGKIPAEFIQEMTNLVLEEERFKPEDLSQLKEDKDALPFLLTPYDVVDENGNRYSEYIMSKGSEDSEDSEDFEVRGLRVGLREYTLEPDTELKVKAFYSFMMGVQDSIDKLLGFGILESGHPFIYEEDSNSSTQDHYTPCITIAPDWSSLIDNIDNDYLEKFVKNMDESNCQLLDDWLEITPSGNLDDIRDKLKIVLSPDLLDMFCQKVFKMINH